MRSVWKLLASVAVITVSSSCIRTNPQLPANTPDVDPVADNLLTFNKLCLEDEQREIAHYIDSIAELSDIPFQLNDDGVYIRTLETGDKGKAIKDGDKISVAYSLELLNGTICSQSDDGKAKVFNVGKREVEKGLDLSVIGMHKSDEFEVIIPYSLAWGVTGNMDCIPPRCPILYRIKIISIN